MNVKSKKKKKQGIVITIPYYNLYIRRKYYTIIYSNQVSILKIQAMTGCYTYTISNNYLVNRKLLISYFEFKLK